MAVISSLCLVKYRGFLPRENPVLVPHCSLHTWTELSDLFEIRELCSTPQGFEVFSDSFRLSLGQESTAAGQKSFEPTGFQNVLSGLYSPVVFSASGANLTDAHLFCLLACDRDSCCDGFILTQVKAGMANWRAGPTQGYRVSEDSKTTLWSLALEFIRLMLPCPNGRGYSHTKSGTKPGLFSMPSIVSILLAIMLI